ncbi:unnamed protein product [Phytomonas sp. Hart1]|nr:unnamed protein product [Phytomonas sp. Hart1]|eukprot:CCW69342.1 unnamed protein product [Phytomonas sp. isolate Hart1]
MCPIIPEEEEIVYASDQVREKDKQMKSMTKCSTQPEGVRIYKEKPVFMFNFSFSIIIGFSIWACIALVVFLLARLNIFNRSNQVCSDTKDRGL